jgi:hypothetical protein
MRIIFILITIFVSTLFCNGQNDRDTVLNTVLSHPYFYNVIQAADGSIYTGTQEGIFKWTGTNYEAISDESGYIGLNNKGKPLIIADGFANYESKRYAYLLPYPNEIRDEFHAGDNSYFYLVSGGRLHIYDILPYSVLYRNQSVRTITPNYVGTYSGIYNKRLRLSFPEFTDGYIREYGDTAFICFNGLVRITKEDTAIFFNSTNVSTLIGDEDIGRVADILYMPSEKRYYLASNKGLYVSGTDFEKATLVYASASKSPAVFISSKFDIVHFAVANLVLRYSQSSTKVDTMATLKDPILDGITVGRVFYLLTQNNLFSLLTNGDVEEITDFKEAHTLLSLTDKELLIASNYGLFHYNLETRKKDVVINAVEFNRRALFRNAQTVYAGSISGLYVLDYQKINELIERNLFSSGKNSVDQKWIYLLVILLLLVTLISVVLMRTRRSLKIVTNELREKIEEEESWDRSSVEAFIRENLTTVSIKSIIKHFDTNTKQLYKVLHPDKPGTIIQHLRQEIVAQMRSEGANAKQIAVATGLSESYVKKCISAIEPKNYNN